MNWFRKAPPPAIPKFEPVRVIETKPKPKDDGIIVEESFMDTIKMKAWNALTRSQGER